MTEKEQRKTEDRRKVKIKDIKIERRKSARRKSDQQNLLFYYVMIVVLGILLTSIVFLSLIWG